MPGTSFLPSLILIILRFSSLTWPSSMLGSSPALVYSLEAASHLKNIKSTVTANSNTYMLLVDTFANTCSIVAVFFFTKSTSQKVGVKKKKKSNQIKNISTVQLSHGV